jgi:hypothetical protein
MKKKLWFKAKRYGWGWYPATWEGWAVTAVFILLISLNAWWIDSGSHSVSDTLITWIPNTVILVIILLGICVATGEKPRWRWGGKH